MSLKFLFTGLRSPLADGLQLAEVNLYSTGSAVVRVRTAENPGGLTSSRYQQAQYVVDGLLTTKWYDAGIARTNRSMLILHMHENERWAQAAPTGCAPTHSSNRNPRRGPISHLHVP